MADLRACSTCVAEPGPAERATRFRAMRTTPLELSEPGRWSASGHPLLLTCNHLCGPPVPYVGHHLIRSLGERNVMSSWNHQGPRGRVDPLEVREELRHVVLVTPH